MQYTCTFIILVYIYVFLWDLNTSNNKIQGEKKISNSSWKSTSFITDLCWLNLISVDTYMIWYRLLKWSDSGGLTPCNLFRAGIYNRFALQRTSVCDHRDNLVISNDTTEELVQSDILWHPITIYGPKLFLLSKIKYSGILCNPTYFPSTLVCRIRQATLHTYS